MSRWRMYSNSKIAKQRKQRRKAQERRDFDRGLAMLNRLRDDQIVHVRHLLRSWCGANAYGSQISESNVHMPVCRRAIERTLQDRP